MSNEIPFTPSDSTLNELLKREYILKVSKWLLGKDEMSVLAQLSESAWESALTIITLSDVVDIFAESNDEQKLRDEIARKSVLVGSWLLSKKIEDASKGFAYWEGVTWDTAVIIHALLIVVSKYRDKLSNNDIKNIELTTVKSCKWLYYKFSQWDKNIKYPFGSADVAKIIVAFVKLCEFNENLYDQARKDYKNDIDKNDDGQWLVTIVEYLLYSKASQSAVISKDSGSEEIFTYWWDDYFTTAEVTEALAVYYHFCLVNKKMDIYEDDLIDGIKNSLVNACMYFEQGQLDGMWGSHIDTIKVVYAYVLIRRLVSSGDNCSNITIIEPEIHTVFKAVRWMCDEKQRFSDGSFMHTMFLTVFFAAALVEVYRSWEPAKNTIEKIYDDALWAAPIRTTPERIKRISVEIKNINLNNEIKEKCKKIEEIEEEKNEDVYKLRSTVYIFISLMLILPIFSCIAYFLFDISFAIENKSFKDFSLYSGGIVTFTGILITAIWNRFVIFNLFTDKHKH